MCSRQGPRSAEILRTRFAALGYRVGFTVRVHQPRTTGTPSNYTTFNGLLRAGRDAGLFKLADVTLRGAPYNDYAAGFNDATRWHTDLTHLIRHDELADTVDRIVVPNTRKRVNRLGVSP